MLGMRPAETCSFHCDAWKRRGRVSMRPPATRARRRPVAYAQSSGSGASTEEDESGSQPSSSEDEAVQDQVKPCRGPGYSSVTQAGPGQVLDPNKKISGRDDGTSCSRPSRTVLHCSAMAAVGRDTSCTASICDLRGDHL